MGDKEKNFLQKMLGKVDEKMKEKSEKTCGCCESNEEEEE